MEEASCLWTRLLEGSDYTQGVVTYVRMPKGIGGRNDAFRCKKSK